MIEIWLGDALDVIKNFKSGSFDLIYIDPPFNTGKTQCSPRDPRLRYTDQFEEYQDWLMEHIREAHRLLTPTGSFFLHLDYREVHYMKVLCDTRFGRDHFKNEIIWAYDYGGRPKNRWPAKHDTILWYVNDKDNYTFNYDSIDRIPYMAPNLVGAEKAARGKTPTDVWWQTIVPTNSKERTGYPTQKPEKLLERIILTHSNPGDNVLDFFAGSGTTGVVAAKHGRHVTLVDKNEGALQTMERRILSLGVETSIRRNTTRKGAGNDG